MLQVPQNPGSYLKFWNNKNWLMSNLIGILTSIVVFPASCEPSSEDKVIYVPQTFGLNELALSYVVY